MSPSATRAPMFRALVRPGIGALTHATPIWEQRPDTEAAEALSTTRTSNRSYDCFNTASRHISSEAGRSRVHTITVTLGRSKSVRMFFLARKSGWSAMLAERVGFEPTDGLPHRLISSQVHSTTLPPLRYAERFRSNFNR